MCLAETETADPVAAAVSARPLPLPPAAAASLSAAQPAPPPRPAPDANALAAWFGPSAHGLVSKQLETLGVEEPADLLELDSDDLAGLEGAMKKVQAKKFARNLEKMAEAAGRPLPKRPTAPPPRQPQHAHSARGAGEAVDLARL